MCARWDGHNRKTTVEETLQISISDFTRRGLVDKDHPTRGDIEWERRFHEEVLGTVTFEVDPTGDRPVVWLFFYTQGDGGKNLAYQIIGLESTPCHFGGVRWWFTCPSPNDNGCDYTRRGELYLPPGEDFFACRECHGLTYKSAQCSYHPLIKPLMKLGSRDRHACL